MKKILSLLLAVTMVFSLSACRQSSAGGNGETAGVESNVEMGDGRRPVFHPGHGSLPQRLGCLPGEGERGAGCRWRC